VARRVAICCSFYRHHGFDFFEFLLLIEKNTISRADWPTGKPGNFPVSPPLHNQKR
jgi:hypothetical protein